MTADTSPALWHLAPGVSAIRPGAVGDGAAELRMIRSALSRGTERLVRAGRVPESEHERMRGPAMEGAFPFPVKYGYCAVAEVISGPEALVGRQVFTLHPHQARFRADPAALLPLPGGLPPARATLTANMETALNAAWDGGIGPGDRVAVIGGGVVGTLIARLCARMPGVEVWLSDLSPRRAAGAEDLGARALAPGAALEGLDAVFETSASAAGMAAALGMLGDEGALVSVGWHGAGETPLPLGGAFHSRRLRVVSSQVGRLPPARAPRWDYRRRLAAAAQLLAEDPGADALIGEEVALEDLPGALDRLLSEDAPGATAVVRYDGA
ncbi:zinc-dependent alcohol dehydrogenase [Rhodovulum sp. DZ06]|uniref:zinc-dependent alcohol dehydrogenase n=1 Tax=Rhodovulum sp. DZ06 TaxID=3425126 RepID=UPI003D32CEF2